jgi:hypothetical protein
MSITDLDEMRQQLIAEVNWADRTELVKLYELIKHVKVEDHGDMYSSCYVVEELSKGSQKLLVLKTRAPLNELKKIENDLSKDPPGNLSPLVLMDLRHAIGSVEDKFDTIGRYADASSQKPREEKDQETQA